MPKTKHGVGDDDFVLLLIMREELGGSKTCSEEERKAYDGVVRNDMVGYGDTRGEKFRQFRQAKSHAPKNGFWLPQVTQFTSQGRACC